MRALFLALLFCGAAAAQCPATIFDPLLNKVHCVNLSTGAQGPQGAAGPTGPAGATGAAGFADTIPLTANYTMDTGTTDCWTPFVFSSTGTGNFTFAPTSVPPSTNCTVSVQNNMTTHTVAVTGGPTLPACVTANGCPVVVIKPDGNGAWTFSNPSTPGATGATGATGAAGSGNNTLCADASGSTTAYTCPSPAPVVTTLTGLIISFIPQTTNTGTATVNVASLGAKTLKAADGSTNISSGGLVGGTAYAFSYDGTNFRQVSSSGGGGGASLHLTQYFFAEDPSTGTYVPNGLDMRACTGCVQATGSSDFAHYDLPFTGTPAMTLSYNMASTQSGNLVLDARTYNNQGGSGTFVWDVDHYCATPGTGSVGSITYGNSQTFTITATGNNTLKSTTLNVDLTSCSPGDAIFIRLTRDAASTYPNTYGFIGLIIRETY